jgi:large subunit ribosomal protein L15
MIRLNTIKAQPGATQKRKRLGRGAGSGLGMTSGKGDKGQLARSGGVSRPGFEGGQMPLYRRIPKRGFTNIQRRSNAVLNLGDFTRSKRISALKEVSLETLREAGALKGRYDRLTILGTGEIKQAFQVKAHRVSPSAKEKIEKAGGKVELLSIPGKTPVRKAKPQTSEKA